MCGFCNVCDGVGVLLICILYSDWGFLNLTEVFLTLTEVFSCFFLSCKANARVKLAKTGHGLHSSTLVVICVVRLLFVLFYVLFVCKCVLPPGDNPTAINKYIISYQNHIMRSLLKCTFRQLLFDMSNRAGLRGEGNKARIGNTEKCLE